jgi:hypothetical protein
MPSDRIAGSALVLGALATLVTMALHPTGADLVRDFDTHARTNVLAHSLALVGLGLIFFGGLGLTRRLRDSTGVATAALVAWGMAVVAGLVAAVASGMIAPHLIQDLAALDGPRAEATSTVLRYNHLVNNGFAAVLVVASALAVVFWSVAILRTRALPKWVGVLGVGVGGLISVAFLSGHVGLDVHGFGLIILTQAVWLVAVGAMLVRSGRSSLGP